MGSYIRFDIIKDLVSFIDSIRIGKHVFHLYSVGIVTRPMILSGNLRIHPRPEDLRGEGGDGPAGSETQGASGVRVQHGK